MVKENRSDWVAVEPEFTNTTADDDLPTVKPASTAYQIHQRKNSKRIRNQLVQKGLPTNLAHLTKAISQAFKNLPPVERSVYDDEATNDRFRFNRESHLRDVAVERKKDNARRERDEILVFEGDGRNTRGARKKELKKKDRVEKKKMKKERKHGKKDSNRSKKRKEKKMKKKMKAIVDSDDDVFGTDDEQSSDEDDSDDNYDSNDQAGENETSSSEDSDDSDSDSDAPPKKKAPPRKFSAAVLTRRDKVRQEKVVKEAYIAERQQDLRTEKASQAKKRLDFLLSQSDIFRHFGQVKEDRGKFYGSKAASASSTGTTNTTNRRDCDIDEDEIDPEELQQVDESDATFLTTQPSTIEFGQMRPYQLEGLNWMIRLQENGVNGILADEMGLGKTLQSISVLVYMLEYTESNGPHLIVVPKSTLSNWMAEIKRWAPTLTAIKFHGKKEEREEIARTILQPGQRDEERSWNVCVTTYEVCNLDKQIFNKFAWSYLIIDEAHRLKNEASAFSKTIRTFETRFRLLLTGTPLQNNLHELWALLNFLVPDVFASSAQFDEWFNLDIDDADEKNRLILQLHKILRPFMLRRLKVDVEKSLPPKHETILFTGMSAVQKKLYKDILLRDIGVLQGGQGGGGGGGSHTAILNIVMQLRKCAGHPYLFPKVEDRSLPPLGEHLVHNCGKMVLLDKLLVRLKELGHRVLLFTQMTRLLDILEDYMVMRRFQYCRIDGNTDYEIREDSIDAFNAPNSEKFIFLLSTRAGGLGINLQTADVVILYDSDWNPQADLQAQDRAHRIGQKRPVQVFRLVTEHTIEEKVVERAQQKLKLDAMVVQSGRLKDKDKLSRQDLLEAVRFGADKVFKSKESTITDDDIDLILEAGKKKTQELNEKLMAADKGDMLDFKLDGSGISAQTYEGVDYSKQDFAQVKAAQAQAELMGILDMGKRERRTIANYNENQLYRQQIASKQGAPKIERKKKEIKLPKHLRLPRLDEWQMFDRDALNALQEEEEKSFRELSEELQNVLRGKPSLPSKAEGEDEKPQEELEEKKTPLTMEDVPPLLNSEQQNSKDRFLAEGFSDWGRRHYTVFLRASAKYGRKEFAKIALEVGKPQSAVDEYAGAFWDEDFGKLRFSEKEYDRSVQFIERGEKKIQLVKALETATSTFLSLFDNPWREAEFLFHNCKDKLFTTEEDMHLLCWAHKYGYGQWDAVKMAIRRSPEFRFDYYLRSLPTEVIGKRCEQLMKAAEKDVELMREKASNNKDTLIHTDCLDYRPPIIDLPRFKELKEMRRKEAKVIVQSEMNELESKVEDIENQIEESQNRLKFLQKCSKDMDGNIRSVAQVRDLPESLLPDLANLVAKSGHNGVISVASTFLHEHGNVASKKHLCAKIEDIAKKEKRAQEGDTRAVWHLLPEYMNLLTVTTLRNLRKEKEERQEKMRGSDKKILVESKDKYDTTKQDGAIGPDGKFVTFSEYIGDEEPRSCKKAFTLFCNATRREVKKSLDAKSRRDKNKVNGMLRERWDNLSKDDKEIWKKWEVWDSKRYKRDVVVFQKRPTNLTQGVNQTHDADLKKRKKDNSSAADSKSAFQIPKKKRSIE